MTSESQDDALPRDRGLQRRRKLEHRIYTDMVSQRPGTYWKTVQKMFAEPRYATTVLRKHLHRFLPCDGPLLTTDRLVLEQQIFRYYRSQSNIQDVLFVGCDAATAHYEKSYFSHARFVTLEPDPANRKFGGTHHVTAPLQELTRHFPPAAFDLIICNGVFGWGLDELDACERAFDECFTCLRQGGHLLVGWNDLPRRRPFPLERIRSLSRFRKYEFPPIRRWRYRTDTAYRHVFDFYIK